MQTLTISPDMVVLAPDGKAVVLVEVRNRQNLTADVAAEIRRNLIEHGIKYGWARFFLMTSQETGYLWDQESLEPGEIPPPTVEFSMVPVIDHYVPSFANNGRLRGSAVELAVSKWLWDLGFGSEHRPNEPDVALAKTDFLQLMKGTHVIFEVDD
jgi:hypothetical protein